MLDSHTTLEKHTLRAIDAFLGAADATRPLLICDADEVLLQFLKTLEGFLHDQGMHLQLDSFMLHGNIRHRADNSAVEAQQVSQLLQEFFTGRIHHSPAVEGAPEALQSLAEHAEICILTNLPGAQEEARRDALHAHGYTFPVICNSGGKGPAVAHIQQSWRAKIAFIDDLPPNHDSVAEKAPDVHRIHYIADERLRPLLKKPESAHHRMDSWADLQTHLLSWALND